MIAAVFLTAAVTRASWATSGFAPADETTIASAPVAPMKPGEVREIGVLAPYQWYPSRYGSPARGRGNSGLNRRGGSGRGNGRGRR